MSSFQENLDFLDFLRPKRQLALRDKLGGRENVEALLRDEMEVQLIPKVRLFVDHTGRLIPAHLGVKAAVCDENRNFYLNRLAETNYEEILIRFQQFFSPGTIFVSAVEFMDRAEAAKGKLMGNNLLANLFNRAAWPLPVPQQEVQDIGRSIQNFFLPAALMAYRSQFPNRKFNIYCGEMAGKILPLTDYNGYDRIIAGMKDGPGVVWYFPNPMQGFSVNAQREAGKLLRQHNLILNGPIEPVLALVGFAGEMARDYNTPGYDCPANSWQSAGRSLYFRAYDDEFRVYDYGLLGHASDGCSGGLVFLG